MKYEILLKTGFVGFQPRTRADNTLLVTALTVQIAPKFELGLLFKERLAHGTIKMVFHNASSCLSFFHWRLSVLGRQQVLCHFELSKDVDQTVFWG
ncbi:hypothetical protein [uncultured Bilophila sp.]|uniref:hypothetical protein n=1 Tax=uncultured Bilophila sp. TaxID=529385 RepID=UPI002621F007|nr:hypothetical protein [uncultured Bilophila sp.]